MAKILSVFKALQIVLVRSRIPHQLKAKFPRVKLIETGWSGVLQCRDKVTRKHFRGNKMGCILKDNVYYCDDLIDVWSFSNPQTQLDPVPYANYLINPPTLTDLRAIVPRDRVKISRDIDKIWTEVVEINPNCKDIIARVVGSLDLEHPFDIGDLIFYRFKNVYEIDKFFKRPNDPPY